MNTRERHDPRWTLAAWGISLLLLLPAVLGMFLFERFLDHYQEMVLRQHRDVFSVVARRVEENLKSANVLWNAFSQGLPEPVQGKLTAEYASVLAERIKRALGIPARVLGYDDEGALVYPPGDFPDRERFRDLNLAVQKLRFGNSVSSETVELTRRVRKFCQDTYGNSNLFFFLWARRFSWSYQPPGQPLKYLGVIGIPKTSPGSFQASIHIEVADRDIPPEMRFRNGLRALPDDLAFGGITASDSGRVIVAKGNPWFPVGRLAELAPSDVAAWHPEGVFLKKPLESPAEGFLVLAMPSPWLLRIPAGTRALVEAAATIAWFLGCHFLTMILLGRRRLSVRLGWQIAFAFGFAGAVPLATLAYLGASRFIELESVERTRRVDLMQKHLIRTDREFRNRIETLQGDTLDFTRELERMEEKGDLTADQVPETLRNAHAILFADARKPGFAPRLFSVQASNLDQTLGAKAEQVKKIILDLFRQILRERGQGEAGGNGGKEGLTLTAQDILGESSPILEMVKTLDDVTKSEYNNTRYISLCRMIPESPNVLRSFSLFIFEAALETTIFFRELIRRPAPRAGPFRVIPIHPDYGSDMEPSLTSDALRETVERTRETQSPETIRFRTQDGEDVLGVTAFTRFLAGHYPMCLMPYGPVLELRDTQGRIVLLFFLAALVAILLVTWTLRMKLVLPIRRLKAGAADVAGGRLDQRLVLDSRDEMGVLAGAFNEMLQGLQERERMRRFVSRSTLADIREEQAGRGAGRLGRSVPAAILCSDIRDFTTLSERCPPDQVVEMLNDYFTEMDFLLQGQGGEIQKLVGDAIVAVFHEGEGLAHPALRAVKAGLEMRAALRAFNADRRRRGLFEIENGIGIHFDTVVEGTVGAAGGRLDFTVIGPAITRAQTLESLSKHARVSKVVVSPEAFAAVAGVFAGTPLDAGGEDALEILPGRQHAD